jgi:hypothetical protein
MVGRLSKSAVLVVLGADAILAADASQKRRVIFLAV